MIDIREKAIEWIKAQKGLYYGIVINLIEEQENRIKELEEINKEHQKINGELQEKLTKLEKENKRLNEIIEGKSIQELGMSDIYKED